jgi:hypothetical protein
MALMAKAQGGFRPAPEGIHQAVCVDVVNLGLQKSVWQGRDTLRHMARIVFQIEARKPDGGRFQVSASFNLTLDERGRLRPFLEAWRGRRFTDEELTHGFDIERLIGVNAYVQILHATRGGNTYANIQSIMPPRLDEPKLGPESYVRVCDREPKPFDGRRDEACGEEAYPVVEDDDIPY